MARKTLSDLGVRALKPRAKRYAYPDPELAGHYVRVQPGGDKSYVAVARNPSGKQVWTTTGSAEVLPIAEARTRAREIIRRLRDGLPAVQPKAESFGAVVENFLRRHVDASGLRSSKEIKRLLAVHVLPRWKDREFTAIRRSDVVTLLDKIADHHSARQADLVLAIVSKIMNWYAIRADDYRPPLVKGMRRWKPKEHDRKRILSDPEIGAVWKAAEANGTFGSLIRLLLLTAQRREKVVTMRWQDIAADGTWTIPTETDEKGKTREKGNAGELMLPPLALDIVRAQPQLGDNPYVLAGRSDGHINGFSKAKRAFDEKLAAELPDVDQWQLHDLRRTARSLMSRAGVLSEHAERVMGHAIAGVEGVYDRHPYQAEKADALQRLATLIDAIVHPHPATVLSMKRERMRP